MGLTVCSPSCGLLRRQGTEMWAVQQVYQSHGRWGKGNPHSGPRALEEMYRPYVHTGTKTEINVLPNTGHASTLCHNYCLTKNAPLCRLFCQLEKKSIHTVSLPVFMYNFFSTLQLCRKSTRESAKPSKTSPPSSPAVDTKVQRCTQTWHQMLFWVTSKVALTKCSRSSRGRLFWKKCAHRYC